MNWARKICINTQINVKPAQHIGKMRRKAFKIEFKQIHLNKTTHTHTFNKGENQPTLNIDVDDDKVLCAISADLIISYANKRRANRKKGEEKESKKENNTF